MKISKPIAFALGAVAALVIGSGTAYAATGGSFILGKSNSASTPTTLTNSQGTALVLKSKAGTSPLKVSNGTKATNLNADQLDGLDSTKFALTAGQTNTVTETGYFIDTDDDNVADTLIAIATCPTGSRLTGGGGDDFTADGVLFVNAPFDKTSWWVASTADVNTADPADVGAYAVCYNPRGAVSGGSFRASTSAAPSSAELGAIKAKLAKKQR